MDPEGADSGHWDELVLRREFLALAHHDLRTPLAVLKGWVETFDRSWDRLSETERQEAVRSMERTLEKLDRRIDALLGEIRAEVLARSPRPSSVDVADVAAIVADRLGGEASVPEGTVVKADREALLHLLLHVAEAQRPVEDPHGTVFLSAKVEPGRLVLDVAVRGGTVPDAEGPLSVAAVNLRAAGWLAAAVGADLQLTPTEDGSAATLILPSG